LMFVFPSFEKKKGKRDSIVSHLEPRTERENPNCNINRNNFSGLI